jgi:hypothetical protein
MQRELDQALELLKEQNQELRKEIEKAKKR